MFKFQIPRLFGHCLLFGYCYLVIGILLIATCYGQNISFEATVDKDQVSLGESIQLSLSFYGTQEVPTPYFPDIDGFKWRYSGPSTRMSIINGKVSSSITHRYQLIPLRAGRFEIPAFSVPFRGETYTSQPISIEVVQGALPPPATSPSPAYPGKPQDLDDMVFLVMQTDKKQAYVNEVVPLTIKLYVTNLALRDIQYPEFTHDDFAVEEFSEPKQYQETLNGIVYNVIEFNTNVFGLRPGELKLGPAQIKCNLLVKKQEGRPRSSFFDDDFFGRGIFDNFFTRYESYPLTLNSIDLPVTIVDLPKENRPEDFNGALGNYNFYLEAEPKEVKVGDPITLKMTITGEGNFKTVQAPALKLGDGFKVYEPQVEQEDGKKTFEQVIVPKDEKLSEIPEISFSFFDTKSQQFKQIARGPLAIKVNPLAEGEHLKVFELSEDGSLENLRQKEILGRDIVFIKDAPGAFRPRGRFLSAQRWFPPLQLVPLLIIMAVCIFQRRKERLTTDVRYARFRRARGRARENLVYAKRLLEAKEPDKFFDAVFKTIQEYLGDKFHLPAAGITANVVEELKSRHIDRQALDKLKECLDNCDMARYAAAGISKEQMLRTFSLLQELIDAFERMKLKIN